MLDFVSPRPWRVECTDHNASVPKLVAGGTLIDLCRFDIDPYVVAYALSRIPRWGAHSDRFWSVAAHSVLGAIQADDPMTALAFLWHDAHEAYTGDVPTPTKRLTGYDDASFARAFRVAVGLPAEMSDREHLLDLRCLVNEAQHLFPEGSDLAWLPKGIDPFDTYLPDDTPGGAHAMFVELDAHLRGTMRDAIEGGVS